MLGITTITNEPSVFIQCHDNNNHNNHNNNNGDGNNNNDGGDNSTTQVTSCLPLDPVQSEIFKHIEEAYKNGEDVRNVLHRIPPEQFAQIKPIANESYRMIRSILDHVDPDLKRLRTLMAPCSNIYRHDIQWVKIEHINDWKYCKLSANVNSNPNSNMNSHPNSHSSTPSQSIQSIQSLNYNNNQNNNYNNHSNLKHLQQDIHQTDNLPPTYQQSILEDQHISHLEINNEDNIISYDPWVLVHPPHVSSQDCEDVERLSQWIQSEVHLLHSTSEFIATKLVIDNCPHIERLKTRLLKEPNYLQSLGVTEEDSKDIYNSIFRSTTTSSFRSWCTIS